MSITSTFDGRPVEKPFAWSFSALDSFETCAKKYYHGKIKKDFPDKGGPDAGWGLKVHAAMADRIMKAKPLPEGMQQWEKWIDWTLENSDRTQVITRAEHKMAITEAFQPCEYFDKNQQPWFRTVADVIKIRLPYIRIIDWKTGNFKEGSDQLLLTAATAFAHYPEATHALCQFVWLKNDLKTEEMFARSEMPYLWARYAPRVTQMKQAAMTSNYPPNPSGLCKKHCPVTTCPYFGKGSY
jgi:hypothetical protein